jgi:hypothetical protein
MFERKNMIKDEILKISASRETDFLIAEIVMNIDFGNHSKSIMRRSDTMIPHYSTDISAAWEIVEQIQKWDFIVGCDTDYKDEQHYCELITDDSNYTAWAITAPLAICRAALLTKSEQN